MSPGQKIFGRFSGLALALAAALLLLGYGPTRRLAGDEAVPAMIAAVAIAAVASLAGALLVYRARHRPHAEAWNAALGAMAARLGIAIVLGVAVALTGAFPVRPLLLWIVIAHAGFLVPDTLLSTQVLARRALAEDR